MEKMVQVQARVVSGWSVNELISSALHSGQQPDLLRVTRRRAQASHRQDQQQGARGRGPPDRLQRMLQGRCGLPRQVPRLRHHPVRRRVSGRCLRLLQWYWGLQRSHQCRCWNHGRLRAELWRHHPRLPGSWTGLWARHSGPGLPSSWTGLWCRHPDTGLPGLWRYTDPGLPGRQPDQPRCKRCVHPLVPATLGDPLLGSAGCEERHRIPPGVSKARVAVFWEAVPLPTRTLMQGQ